MATHSEFARLVARPIDRVHIAASTIPTRDELHAIEGYEVSPGDAALVAPFLADRGMTWSEVRTPLRYVAADRIRARLDECERCGVISFDGDHIAYTPAGRLAAQAVFDAHAVALQGMWSNTADQVDELADMIEPVAAAAISAGRPSSLLIDNTLGATQPTPASRLWRSLATVRRYRADCHAQAWSEAGHTAQSIVALAANTPERQPIEARTDELNADIWTQLPDHHQLRFVALLAALDGAGTPT